MYRFEYPDQIWLLKRAGYKWIRPYNWVRYVNDNGDRFHAIIFKGGINLHFDKQMKNGNINYHSAPPKTEKTSSEIKRFKKIINGLIL